MEEKAAVSFGRIDNEAVYNVVNVAILLGTNVREVRRLCREGKLHACKVSREFRIKGSCISEMLDCKCQAFLEKK